MSKNQTDYTEPDHIGYLLNENESYLLNEDGSLLVLQGDPATSFTTTTKNRTTYAEVSGG